jgi:hypothetical protein
MRLVLKEHLREGGAEGGVGRVESALKQFCRCIQCGRQWLHTVNFLKASGSFAEWLVRSGGVLEQISALGRTATSIVLTSPLERKPSRWCRRRADRADLDVYLSVGT